MLGIDFRFQSLYNLLKQMSKNVDISVNLKYDRNREHTFVLK